MIEDAIAVGIVAAVFGIGVGLAQAELSAYVANSCVFVWRWQHTAISCCVGSVLGFLMVYR